MQQLGPITRLQIQTASLKVGASPHQRYDPAALLAVPALILDADGVVGVTAAGDKVIDVHHRDHPASKHRRGENGLSFGFTGHYAAMRAHFGNHLADGIAGENVLIAADHLLGEDDLAPGLVVVTAAGPVALKRIMVAAPCVEFARYALRFPDDARPDRTVTAAIAFLHDGLRGYYAAPATPPATVRVGDMVYRV